MTTLDVPVDNHLPRIAESIETAMKDQNTARVRRACVEFLTTSAQFFKVPECSVRVLAARPLRVREQWTHELFGDYAPDAMSIRVWLRTAVRKEVTSFGTFLSTLCTSSAIISTFKSSHLRIPGILAASTRERPCSTTMREELPRSACIGWRCRVDDGALTGPGQTGVDGDHIWRSRCITKSVRVPGANAAAYSLLSHPFKDSPPFIINKGIVRSYVADFWADSMPRIRAIGSE
jgi:hypothetical protein